MTTGPSSQLVSARLPTRFGEFTIHALAGNDDERAPVAIAMGDVAAATAPLVRLHSECLTGDALHSLRCDCGFQLEAALSMIAADGVGLVVYLRQEGRGIGIVNKIRAYALQDAVVDTVEANERLGFAADQRDYGEAMQLLRAFGITRLRLMSNNPRKVDALGAAGIEVVERVPMRFGRNPHNEHYLSTKSGKLGHWL